MFVAFNVNCCSCCHCCFYVVTAVPMLSQFFFCFFFCCCCFLSFFFFFFNLDGMPAMSDVALLSGISGLSFDFSCLSPLLFCFVLFCFVVLFCFSPASSSCSFCFVIFLLMVHSPDLFFFFFLLENSQIFFVKG